MKLLILLAVETNLESWCIFPQIVGFGPLLIVSGTGTVYMPYCALLSDLGKFQLLQGPVPKCIQPRVIKAANILSFFVF